LELGHFRKVNEDVRPDYFGNEVLTYGSPLMNLRLVKDRGQWSIDLDRPTSAETGMISKM
jgi:hypothetical protein